MQFSARPPRDHSQAPVAHSLGKFPPRGKHHRNGHCLGIITRQAPLERPYVSPNFSETNAVDTTLHGSDRETIRGHTAPLEQHWLGISRNTGTVETTPPRNASETTTTFPLATTLPQKFSAATQSFRHNHSPRLSQMYAVSTTRQGSQWDIDFSANLHYLRQRHDS